MSVEAAEGDPLVKGGSLANGRPLATSSSVIEEVLQEIKADTHSGAAELVKRGAKLLLDMLKQGGPDETEEIKAVGQALLDAQPAMAPMVNLVNHLFHAIDALQDPITISEKGRTAVQGFLDSLITAPEKIKGHALPLLKGKSRVMTHSYSSTVLKVLGQAPVSEIICPESRPLAEGVRTAKELGAKGIAVRLVTDFAAFSLVGECDLVMVGADAVSLEGVINKIGTYGLALAAKAKGVPFYILAGMEKFLPPPLSHALRIEKRDPKEITKETIPHVEAENVYFDFTPLALITGVVTEQGVIAGDKVAEVLKGMVFSEGLK
jgi:translation initiation factor eIF-2B subunit delta